MQKGYKNTAYFAINIHIIKAQKNQVKCLRYMIVKMHKYMLFTTKTLQLNFCDNYICKNN